MNTRKIVILLFFITANLNGLAQANDYYTENISRIDAYINGPIKLYSCEGGITFPIKYKASKIRIETFV